VKTRQGDTLAVLERDDGPRLATLFFRIPGEPSSLTTANAFLAGRSLAQLDVALARVELPLKAAGTLRYVHPLVPDPLDALDELEIGSDLPRVRDNLERVIATHDALAASLPMQYVHGDFAFPNMLVEGRRVAGLVDFEFAGPDFRAADLATALYVIAVRADTSALWPSLEAFSRAYRTALPLDPVEVAAVPALMLRRSAIGLVHWIGRWRQGIAPRDEPLSRARRSAQFAAWLDANAPRVAVVASGEKQPR
jgi:homoserine kinase type II